MECIESVSFSGLWRFAVGVRRERPARLAFGGMIPLTPQAIRKVSVAIDPAASNAPCMRSRDPERHKCRMNNQKQR